MKFIKKILCLLYFHNWKYDVENHTCEGISSHITSMDVQVRECPWCERKQHHMMPRINGHWNSWRDADFKPNEHFKFKRAYNQR